MQNLKKIVELRNKWHQFDNHTKEFEKAIRKECENEGIDFFVVQCVSEHFEKIKTVGNLDEFKA